jgi:CRISPR-associated protein Cas2
MEPVIETAPSTPDRWWFDAFPLSPYRSAPPGSKDMLVLLAYDITHSRRLQKVAKTCEGFGVRVQYSLFECHLTERELDDLWARLLGLIDETEDRIVAYRLDGHSSTLTRTAGTMICSEKAVCYLF